MEDFDATLPPKRAREPENNNENYTPGDFDPDRTIPNRRMRREMGDFSAGDVIADRYQVVSILGRGAMGVVYRCFDRLSSIEVALKGLPPELAGNDWEFKEIKKNFHLVHKLHHPNIANYNNLEFDLNSGGYFLMMEFVDGVELRTYMENNRPDHATIIKIIFQIASALDYAHEQQILHRDIKPGNIMIDRNGVVKILDFGLAAQIHSSMSKVSMVQDSSGTAPYMSPEQWRGRRQNASCDQYALGVVAYEMFAGFLPFESTDFNVLRSAVLNETPEELENVSPAIQTAVAKALSKIPEERFESCTAFAQALNGTDALRIAEEKRKEEERKAREIEEKRKEEERRKKEAEERAAVSGSLSGQTFTAQLPNGVKLEMVRIPNCKKDGFMMGSYDGDDDEKPQHKVYLTRDFYLGKYEVTQAQWQALMGNNPSYFKGANLPVEQVSYNDAIEFCEKLTARGHNEGWFDRDWKFTLPTEAQWEYACRAGTTTAYSYGNNADSSKMRHYCDSNNGTVEVGPLGYHNAFGLYDMHGNVLEWCLDSCTYEGGRGIVTNTYNGVQTDPLCTTGSFRVLRGGSWLNVARHCRSASRYYYDPTLRSDDVGFRLALVQTD